MVNPSGEIAGARQRPTQNSFERVRRYARNHNQRLTEVARHVIAGHDLE